VITVRLIFYFDVSDHRTLPKNLVQEIQQFQVADFAKRYFNTHRTGLLFRRRVPVEQLMSWQKVGSPSFLNL